jgi:hypothetical protein
MASKTNSNLCDGIFFEEFMWWYFFEEFMWWYIVAMNYIFTCWEH